MSNQAHLEAVDIGISETDRAAVASALRAPGRRTLLLLRGAMFGIGAGALYGIYMHLTANVEFELEIRPTSGLADVFGEALRGASPLLAPGILALAALLGAAPPRFPPRGDADVVVSRLRVARGGDGDGGKWQKWAERCQRRRATQGAWHTTQVGILYAATHRICTRRPKTWLQLQVIYVPFSWGPCPCDHDFQNDSDGANATEYCNRPASRDLIHNNNDNCLTD